MSSRTRKSESDSSSSDSDFEDDAPQMATSEETQYISKEVIARSAAIRRFAVEVRKSVKELVELEKTGEKGLAWIDPNISKWALQYRGFGTTRNADREGDPSLAHVFAIGLHQYHNSSHLPILGIFNESLSGNQYVGNSSGDASIEKSHCRGNFILLPTGQSSQTFSPSLAAYIPPDQIWDTKNQEWSSVNIKSIIEYPRKTLTSKLGTQYTIISTMPKKDGTIDPLADPVETLHNSGQSAVGPELSFKLVKHPKDSRYVKYHLTPEQVEGVIARIKKAIDSNTIKADLLNFKVALTPPGKRWSDVLNDIMSTAATSNLAELMISTPFTVSFTLEMKYVLSGMYVKEEQLNV